jgi:hypothetical protein
MMKLAALMALASFATIPAAARELKSCSELGVGIENVLWSANAVWHRSFYNGK